ncbi:MAG: phosphoglucomutase/phosphomannomutase family protein [bacterium]|nr:phosphoglucomutase/phosphomannomutase family protein [bacterium]
MIKFGTDGWRAILGNEFTDENVSKVTLAIGAYVLETFGREKEIIIGYDPRHKADYYAKYCAKILSQRGFNIVLSDRIVPTPVLAYNALERNACAIMFTASHNPPEYLGMKFIPDYAGPATSEITDKIIKELDKEIPLFGSKNYKTEDFSIAYFNHLNNIIDFEKIKNLKSKIIYDGLYSASIGFFDKLLKDHEINFDTLHMFHDPDFGGLMPDPKPKYLQDLIKNIKDGNIAIGIANDGDADRFGVIDENGNYVLPDVIISILLKYLIKKGYTGSVVKTVGSSILIDIVAQKLGVNVIETAVGFKHVGQAMRENDVIIGGEDSGGLSIKGHIPEKDGLLANLLLLEAVADSGKTLAELHNEIYEFAGTKFYTDRKDIHKTNSEEINKILDSFKKYSDIGEYKITETNLKDGVKLMLGNSKKILVRPSGTEPLLRIYFETDTIEDLAKLENSTLDLLKDFV